MESEFGNWMKARVGFRADHATVALGQHGGISAARGELYHIGWQRLSSFALYAFVAAIVVRNFTHAAAGESLLMPNLLGGFAVIAYVTAYFGKMRTRSHAWIAYGHLNRPVSREEMVMLQDLATRNRSESKPRLARMLIVAGPKGFENAALDCAQSSGIECYQRMESGFARTEGQSQ